LIVELPLGWEEVDDPVLGKYFIDHNTGKKLLIFYILIPYYRKINTSLILFNVNSNVKIKVKCCLNLLMVFGIPGYQIISNDMDLST